MYSYNSLVPERNHGIEYIKKNSEHNLIRYHTYVLHSLVSISLSHSLCIYIYIYIYIHIIPASQVSDLAFEEFNGFPGKNAFYGAPKLAARISAQLAKPFMFEYAGGHVGNIQAPAGTSDAIVNIVRGILGFFQLTVKTTQRVYTVEEVGIITIIILLLILILLLLLLLIIIIIIIIIICRLGDGFLQSTLIIPYNSLQYIIQLS